MFDRFTHPKVFDRICNDHKGTLYCVSDMLRFALNSTTPSSHTWKYEKKGFKESFDRIMLSKVESDPHRHLAREFFRLICDEPMTIYEYDRMSEALRRLVKVKVPKLLNSSLDRLKPYIYGGVFVADAMTLAHVLRIYDVNTDIFMYIKEYRKMLINFINEENKKIPISFKPRERCDTSLYFDCFISF